MLQREHLMTWFVSICELRSPADMSAWRFFVDRIISPKNKVNLAVVGKYIEHRMPKKYL